MTDPADAIAPLLERWANFYVIMSASAATLIGLLFVVITLAADRRAEDKAAVRKIHVYLTPAVVYFGSVLGIAALLTFPNHDVRTATLCICLTGIAGLFFNGSILLGTGRKSYEDLGDVIAHAVLPCLTYALVVLGGAWVHRDAQRGLTIVAVAMLALLTLAIRNSWAIAVGVVSNGSGRK